MINGQIIVVICEVMCYNDFGFANIEVEDLAFPQHRNV